MDFSVKCTWTIKHNIVKKSNWSPFAVKCILYNATIHKTENHLTKPKEIFVIVCVQFRFDYIDNEMNNITYTTYLTNRFIYCFCLNLCMIFLIRISKYQGNSIMLLVFLLHIVIRIYKFAKLFEFLYFVCSNGEKWTIHLLPCGFSFKCIRF